MTKICVWGDSTGRGAFDKEKGGWVNRLHVWGLENHFYVYNFSVSSNNTHGVLYALEKEIGIIEKIEPEKEYIYMFAIGSNDARYIDKKSNKVVPLTEFKLNLEKIIKLAKKMTKKIIFVGLKKIDESKTTPIPWATTEYYENDDLQKYNKCIMEVCKQNNVGFIPVWTLLDNNDFEDGLHPNSQGHEKLYKKISSYMHKNNFFNKNI